MHNDLVADSMMGNAMLANLASMAAREMAMPLQVPSLRGEFIVEGQFVPPFLRYRLDVCTWPILLVDIRESQWTVLFGGVSVRNFLGNS